MVVLPPINTHLMKTIILLMKKSIEIAINKIKMIFMKVVKKKVPMKITDMIMMTKNLIKMVNLMTNLLMRKQIQKLKMKKANKEVRKRELQILLIGEKKTVSSEHS